MAKIIKKHFNYFFTEMIGKTKRFCTLKDVAREAGVSYATVSNYINRKDLVKKETSNKIKQAIDKLKYTPALQTRYLKLQKTNTVGIILPDIVNNYFAILAKTIEEIMRKNGYETVIYNTNYMEDEEERALGYFVSRRVLGLMLMSIRREFNSLKNLISNHNLPVVVLDNYVRGLNSWTIVQDNFKGSYKITKHLICEHGYREIGFISSNFKVMTVQERIKGYRKALEDFNLKFIDDYLVEGNYDPNHGYNATKYLLNLKNPPRAISVSTSMYSIGMLRAIKELGLRIPEDIAVTSFDDYDFASITDPSMTALKRVDYKIGEMGANIMINILKGEEELKKNIVRIDTPLIIRRSCGCQRE